MELKKLEYDLTVCKVEKITDIDISTDFFSLAKQMKKYLWFVRQKIHLKKQQSEMMGGKVFVFRAFSIFH
jgi:hypothetical protein